MTDILNATIEISPEVLCQEVSGETVLLDLKSESYFGLDATGTRIWQLIQDDGNLSAAFNTMLGEFSVEEDQLLKDFSELIQQLSDAKLITFEA